MDPIWPLPGNSLRLPQAPPARRTGGAEGTGTAGPGWSGAGWGPSLSPLAGRSRRPQGGTLGCGGEWNRGTALGLPRRALTPLTGIRCRPGASTWHGWPWQEEGAVCALGRGAVEGPGAYSAGVTQTHLRKVYRVQRAGRTSHSIGSSASAPRNLSNTREPHQSGSYSVGLSREAIAHGH